MNSKKLGKYSSTNYNSFFYNNKKYKKISYQNPIKKLSNTQVSNSLDKSFVNNSILTTKLNSSESFLYKSIYINNSFKLFKMQHLSIKNQFYTSTHKNSQQTDYKKLILRKLSENLEKLKLNRNPLKIDKIDNLKNNTSIIKSEVENERKIERISFFDKIFRNELFNVDNRTISPDYDKDKSSFYLKESTKNRALIRNYIYQREKKYEKDLKERKRFINELNKNYKRIKIIYNDAVKNKINRMINYNSFLQDKIKIMNQEDIELQNKIEILIKQIKELFIQIRIKSDRLWVLFDIRNFLICVKEKISLKQLPLVFRFYNSNYLYEITKLNEIDISTMKRKNIKNNKSNFFHIPTNLLIYIKSLNGIENENIEEKFKKYLDPGFKIFESPEDFIKIYITTEKKILDYLKNYLFDKNIEEKIKYGLLSTIKNIENERNIFQKNFDDTKNSYIEIKRNNDKMSKRKLKFSISYGDFKSEKKNNEEEYKLQDIIIKYNQEKNDEKFLKLIRSNNDVEKINFLYKFYQLKKVKNFETKKEYVYFYVISNILNFYKICPNYFHIQGNFNIKIFNEYINNTLNSDKVKDWEKRKNIICLLNIYERAINNFLNEYNEKIKMFKKTDTFYMIRKEKVNEKKRLLAEEKKFVDLKIKSMKINKYNRKFLKYRFIQRNNLSNASLTNIFLKGKSFEIKKNNKKDDSENYMLKY